MFSSQTKNPDLGKFWRTLKWKLFFLNSGHLEYFTTIGYILWAFNNFAVIWYNFTLAVLGILYQEKSGII
jgi:hypothetical protein